VETTETLFQFYANTVICMVSKTQLNVSILQHHYPTSGRNLSSALCAVYKLCGGPSFFLWQSTSFCKKLPSHFEATSETPTHFDISSSCTVDDVGAKSVVMKKIGKLKDVRGCNGDRARRPDVQLPIGLMIWC
jgi:hypothetical protein